MKRGFACALLAAVILMHAPLADSYPLDGEDASGIRRLQGYAKAPFQPPGARWTDEQIRLHLLAHAAADFDRNPENPLLRAALEQLLKNRNPSYAMVLVDFTDPGDIQWAGLRADLQQNPGSVGKLLCMLALFSALADAFPAIADRERILRETVVPGGEWVVGGEHQVPRYDRGAGVNRFGVLRADDRFRLSEWIDHAISASANGAGSVIWREAMLLRHLGAGYPADERSAEQFFRRTPKSELSALARAVIVAPLRAAGLDPGALMQGSFFSGAGKRLVPGSTSHATPRELARFMFRMEQGRLVDAWSSLEMKKYTYITKRRYRYVYAPELSRSAVFFKSGSLYQCRAEDNFRCGKYMGNVRNMMNSVTLVETLPDDPKPRRYIAALMSNVLRTNSAWDHSRIAAAVHEIVAERRGVALREQPSQTELEEVGKSD